MALRRQKWFNKRLFTTLFIGLIILIASFIGYKIYKSHKRQHQVVIPSNAPTQTTTTNSSTNNSDKQPIPSTGSTSSGSSQKISTNSTSSASADTGPQAPYGSFVSNHGQKTPADAEESVCITTPGATCYIQFTKDGVTKKLAIKTADSNGSAIWDWSISEAGFTTGSWQVSAVASLNNKTVTTIDKVLLEVK